MALHAFSIGHGSADDPTLLLNRSRYSYGPTLRGGRCRDRAMGRTLRLRERDR